jgi:type IV secretion system protein VirB11
VSTVKQLQRERLHAQLAHDFGQTIGAALADRDVTEIMCNADGTVWLKTHTAGMVPTGERLTPQQAERILGTVADLLAKQVTPSQPLLQGELPLTGDRFQGWLPPVVPAPAFVIRRHAPVIYTLEDYVHQGVLDPWQAQALRESVLCRHNIVVTGATDSGKTTLLNGLLHEIIAQGDTGERIVILEDTTELQCQARNLLQLHTTEEVPLRELVRSCMRARPDRIIIGEVRGGEALELLKAWNTGHKGGLTSLHANSPEDALVRLDMLVLEAGLQQPVPLLVQAAIDRIVHIELTPQGRKVTAIAEVARPERHSLITLQPVQSVGGLETRHQGNGAVHTNVS